jgi:16S rRNA (cytosine1402-N4)-methyltransferase
VLLEEVLRVLRNGPGLYLDATLGDGGHAEALLEAEPGARLLGCDRDPASLAFAETRLMRFSGRASFAQASFRDLPAAHARAGGEPLTGALFDLGVSSRQLDDPARGMSFRSEGPLDMRMDRAAGSPASDRLREVEPDELAEVLRSFGDLPDARRLARHLVAEARAGRLATSRDLVGTIDRSGGPRHPRRYARVFQALRMWVNDEVGELEAALRWLPDAMLDGGVLVTLAYHSGEDRRIKQALRGSASRARAVRRLPEVIDERPPEGRWDELVKGVVTPSAEEQARNPRARSARLRAVRRRRPGTWMSEAPVRPGA